MFIGSIRSIKTTIVIDDMALESTEDTAKLLSIASHHCNLNSHFFAKIYSRKTNIFVIYL